MNTPKKILVIRNDKLGDFMLAWPSFALLKKQYPDTEVTVVIPSYTKPIAEICPWIDNIITDDAHNSVLSDALQLSKIIKKYNFDVSISLFSEMRTALAIRLAGIKQRIGPATKLAQVFLNKRLKQNRSLSSKPDFEYNLDLIRYFISIQGDEVVKLQPAPYLQFDQQEINKLKLSYRREHNINSGTKLVFIHAGSGGSAINLSLQQFSELARLIDNSNKVHFVLTAGPDELIVANELSRLISNLKYSVYHSTEGLVSFSKFISICDLFISGSTGPLHIAGALDVKTVAFYPARKSATPLRWQTINQQYKSIYFSPEKYTGSADMQTIDIAMCAKKINQHLSQLDAN